jgi:hypothetical protein
MAVPLKTGAAFEARVPVALFDTHDPSETLGFDVRQDGQRFLISRTLAEGAARPLNICTNWLAGMKK